MTLDPNFARLLRSISGHEDLDVALDILGGEKTVAPETAAVLPVVNPVTPDHPSPNHHPTAVEESAVVGDNPFAPKRKMKEVAAGRDASIQMYDFRTMNLLRTVNRLSAQLGLLQQVVDKTVPDLIAQMRSRITDRPTADQALNLYDLAWFQKQPYSAGAKISLAVALIEMVRPIYGSGPLLWQRLAARDPDTLRLVVYTLPVDAPPG